MDSDSASCHRWKNGNMMPDSQKKQIITTIRNHDLTESSPFIIEGLLAILLTFHSNLPTFIIHMFILIGALWICTGTIMALKCMATIFIIRHNKFSYKTDNVKLVYEKNNKLIITGQNGDECVTMQSAYNFKRNKPIVIIRIKSKITAYVAKE